MSEDGKTIEDRLAGELLATFGRRDAAQRELDAHFEPLARALFEHRYTGWRQWHDYQGYRAEVQPDGLIDFTIEVYVGSGDTDYESVTASPAVFVSLAAFKQHLAWLAEKVARELLADQIKRDAKLAEMERQTYLQLKAKYEGT